MSMSLPEDELNEAGIFRLNDYWRTVEAPAFCGDDPVPGICA